MKSDYRFRDLDATDVSNHSRVSDVVPSPENVSQVTPGANCEHLNKTVATVRGVPYHHCPDCGSVLDWIPQPSEIEQLRAINAQLVAALRELITQGLVFSENSNAKNNVNRTWRVALHNASATLNAAEKESNK